MHFFPLFLPIFLLPFFITILTLRVPHSGPKKSHFLDKKRGKKRVFFRQKKCFFKKVFFLTKNVTPDFFFDPFLVIFSIPVLTLRVPHLDEKNTIFLTPKMPIFDVFVKHPFCTLFCTFLHFFAHFFWSFFCTFF